MKKKNIRVLIVEDDPMVGEMVQGMLEDIGYNVIGRGVDGLQAIEMAQTLRPYVILMDLQMPNMDGIEAARQINNRHPIPVVALTDYETSALIEQASEAGVGAYLVKPSDAHEIERAITIAIARFDDMAALKMRNKELDAFAHTVAHGLKDSLNLILGYASILQEEARLPDELQHYLNAIVQNGHKMDNVIDELQLLAGVRETKMELEILNMSRIVAGARQRLTYMIEEYRAELIFPDHWPIALGYAPWVEEMWTNYLSNGMKYGGQPPRLQLGATARSDGMVRFWVRDNGPGLTPEEQVRVFGQFTQLHKIQVQGHGLGLSIVQRIAEKLGGQVGVESVVGQGSLFWFTLPTP